MQTIMQTMERIVEARELLCWLQYRGEFEFVRRDDYRLERAIRLSNWPRRPDSVRTKAQRRGYNKSRKWWWVNPQRHVSDALHCSISRYRCILSFADGLTAAGWSVLLNEHFDGQKPREFSHDPDGWTVPVYYLFGRAWGSYQWWNLLGSLQTIAPERRYEVFRRTAQHFLAHPWDEELFLIV